MGFWAQEPHAHTPPHLPPFQDGFGSNPVQVGLWLPSQREMLVSAAPAFTSPSCWVVHALPSGRPSGRPHHLWDTPLMCSSHKYLWSIHWGLGSKSHPHAELDLAQILTLKLGISPVQGTAGLRAGPRVNDLVRALGTPGPLSSSL